jgi:hypothetical protein
MRFDFLIHSAVLPQARAPYQPFIRYNATTADTRPFGPNRLGWHPAAQAEETPQAEPSQDDFPFD